MKLPTPGSLRCFPALFIEQGKNMGEGKNFIAQFNYKIAENEEDFRNLLKEQLGEGEAGQVIQVLAERADQKNHAGAMDHLSFYRFKNENLPRSLAISIGFEGDLIGQTCDWIDAHPEHFGTRILDQGCDIGLISLFMAKRFPGKEITAVDRCREAVALANTLKEQLKIDNVRFLDPDQWKSEIRAERKKSGHSGKGTGAKQNTGTYDTVFSSRTLQENLDVRRISGLAFSPFAEKVRVKENLFQSYVRKMKKLTAENGNFISIERLYQPSARAAYLIALQRAGFDLGAAEIEEIDARDLDQHEKLGIFIAKEAGKRNRQKSPARAVTLQDEEKDAVQESAAAYGHGKETVRRIADGFIRRLNRELPEYANEEADLVLETEQAELIRGVYLFEGRQVIGKLAVYQSGDDPDSLWYYQGAWSRDHRIARYPAAIRKEVMENLDSEIREFQRMNYTACAFSQKKDGRELISRDPRRKK